MSSCCHQTPLLDYVDPAGLVMLKSEIPDGGDYEEMCDSVEQHPRAAKQALKTFIAYRLCTCCQGLPGILLRVDGEAGLQICNAKQVEETASADDSTIATALQPTVQNDSLEAKKATLEVPSLDLANMDQNRKCVRRTRKPKNNKQVADDCDEATGKSSGSSSSDAENNHRAIFCESPLTTKTQISHIFPGKELVPTKIQETASDILQKFKIVWLCGPPGSGKTCTCQMLLKELEKKGVIPFTVTRVEDLVGGKIGRDQESMVLLDGALGEISLDRPAYDQLREFMQKRSKLPKKNRCYLVITVYPHVLREMLDLDQHQRDPVVEVPTVVHLTEELLDEATKTRMLQFHLQEFHLDPAEVTDTIEILKTNSTSGVFPGCCRLLGEMFSFSIPVELSAASHRVFVPLLKRMLSDSKAGETTAAVLAMTMSGFSRFLHNPKETKRRLDDLGLPAISGYHLEKLAHNLKGFVLAENGDGFMNRELYTAVGLALGWSFLWPRLLNVCDSKFLVQYVRVQDETSDVFVSIPDGLDNRELLMQRMHELILSGQIAEVCQHPAFCCQKFLKEFEMFLKNTKNYSQQLVTATDSVKHMPLLYWSTWSPSPLLTEWVMKILSGTPAADSLRPDLLASAAFACALFADRTMSCILDSRLQIIMKELEEVIQEEIPDVRVPFPDEKQIVCREAKEKAFRIRKRFETTALYYAGYRGSAIPETLLYARMSDEDIQIQLPKKQWHFAVRLLGDRETVCLDEMGNTLLHAAAKTGDVEAVEFAFRAVMQLGENEKDVEDMSDNGAAADTSCPAGASLDFDESHSLPVLADHSQDVSGPTESLKNNSAVDRKNNLGLTPLHVLCFVGSKSSAEYLVGKNADVNARSEKGHTPLHLACLNGHTITAEFLISKHADVNAKSSLGHTPLYLACQNGHTRTAKILIDGKADTQIAPQDGLTPLHIASHNGEKDTVSLLLEYVEDVDAQSECGLTSLHCACRDGRTECASLLVKAKANVNLKTAEGFTPLHLACRGNHTGTMVFLIKHGADGQSKDHEGNMPLELAAEEVRRTISRTSGRHFWMGRQHLEHNLNMSRNEMLADRRELERHMNISRND
ncbi:hypothetical protein BaRGS_00004243, partial [Batillaria attramentaria]